MNTNTKYDLDTIRHSTAHLMAQAIQEIFPELVVQLGIGPVIEHGFYYDIEMDHTLHQDDLQKIEDKMREIIKRKLPITRHEIEKNDAIKLFKEKKQLLKIELINDFPLEEPITYYKQGDDFLDLCRGPHVSNTADLPTSFKLLTTAGAYWRNDQKRKMLQRVYAACFLKSDELKQHLNFLEEAKKRDHRKLGKELGLFIFDPVAPASPFFMPKGAFIYNSLVDYMRRIYKIYNYQEVITPQVLDVNLWHTSGHYENYKDNMYFTHIDEREFALKPMNCPCHMLMFAHHQYSYRDLPLRFADFGRLHRYERSGVVAGLTRVRTFCQDDAHIFTQPEQIQDEISSLMEMYFTCYEHFGFKNIKIQLATRPPERIGDEEIWNNAENALKSALEKSGKEFSINEGDGAFYGPKIDMQISDAIGRFHQLGTIQLDFNLPERFDLTYINDQGARVRPVVIHRALLGSLERFIGVFIEHVAGVLPFWIAPEQIRIVPVKNELHLDYAKQVAAKLQMHNFRVHVDDRNESLGLKTRQAQTSKIPFMVVIGDKEIEQQTLTARKYGEQKQTSLSQEEWISEWLKLNQDMVPQKFRV